VARKKQHTDRNRAGHFAVRYGVVAIPHLPATVRVKRFKPGVHGMGAGTVAYARHAGFEQYELYFRERVSAPTAAHEAVHAVQYICADKCIDMTAEKEHVAYLVDYLLAKILGYSQQ
jgi:hypothetical protein